MAKVVRFKVIHWSFPLFPVESYCEFFNHIDNDRLFIADKEYLVGFLFVLNETTEAYVVSLNGGQSYHGYRNVIGTYNHKPVCY